MKTWLANLWDSLRSSFWFLPGLLAGAAVLLSAAAPVIDEYADIERRRSLGWLQSSAPAARSTLSAVAGAMITVAGVVFSMTMLTLSLTTSQFGSRLLRTFMDRNITQLTLGTFLATSIYCLLVLRSVREEAGRESVPHLAVGLGVVMAVVSLGLLIAFTHHVARSIQAQTVVRAVAGDLDHAITRLYPGSRDEEAPAEPHRNAAQCWQPPGKPAAEVPATSEGYLQGVDFGGIVRLAREEDLVLQLERRPGQFVTRGSPLVRVFTESGELPDDLEARINAAFLTGSRRTPRQDVECAISELVELAVRALSPGVNDPFTAMTCIDYLGAALCRLAGRNIDSPCREDEDGRVRIVVEPVTFADALNAAFDQIRQYGGGSVSVTIRLLEALETLAGRVETEAQRAAVRRQTEMIERAASANFAEPEDQADVKQQVERVLHRLSPEAPRAMRAEGSDAQRSSSGTKSRSVSPT